MKKLLLIFSIFSFLLFFSQKIEKLPLKKYKIANLSDSLRETSGLSFFNGKLFSFNDSGNAPEIFEININSKNLKTYRIDAKNVDWEALTSDQDNFYIGDFGNNCGCRKDLVIYKASFENGSKISVSKKISFYYPEQNDFSSKSLNHNFDAEAMVFFDKKIHLFTKEWKSKNVTHYTINPGISENQPAQKVETFSTGFVVTDASFFQNKLYIIGYTKKGKVYLDVFEITDSQHFFKAFPKRYYLGSALKIGQVEGLAINQDGLYFSSEHFKTPICNIPQSLYFVPFEKLK